MNVNVSYLNETECYCLFNDLQVPVSVVFAWVLDINMNLDFNLLETGSLALSVLVTAFTLQVYTALLVNLLDSN